MPAISSKPFILKSAEAQAANSSAPVIVGQAAAQAPAGAMASVTAAAGAIRTMWAGVTATVAEDATTQTGLNAGGAHHIATIYQIKTENVTTLVATDETNAQSLTLLPGSGTVTV